MLYMYPLLLTLIAGSLVLVAKNTTSLMSAPLVCLNSSMKELELIVALYSKLYCVKSDSSVKFSCKGISKSDIDKKSVYDLYLNVLKTKKIEAGVNTGIRMINNQMTTYQQTRAGFTYFYYKRKVLDDGVSTIPLNMCLM